MIFTRIQQKEFISVKLPVKRVDFDFHIAVKDIHQLDFLVPVIGSGDFPLLQLNPRRKIFAVPNQLKFTVHNEAPFTVLTFSDTFTEYNNIRYYYITSFFQLQLIFEFF